MIYAFTNYPDLALASSNPFRNLGCSDSEYMNKESHLLLANRAKFLGSISLRVRACV
jgi:hypothetical protein